MAVVRKKKQACKHEIQKLQKKVSSKKVKDEFSTIQQRMGGQGDDSHSHKARRFCFVFVFAYLHWLASTHDKDTLKFCLQRR